MDSSKGTEKRALDDKALKKIIGASLVTGVTAAGIGSFMKRMAAKERRDKAMKVDESKNAIVVPISIDGFLRDLPKPEASSGSDKGSVADGGRAAKSAPVKPEGAEKPKPKPKLVSTDGMTKEEIAAKKRSILARSGRKMDFFKSAKAGTDDASEKNDSPKDSTSDDEKQKRSGDGGEGDGRVLLRDQEGKFVSPTDPVAVELAEKTAQNAAQDTVRRIWDFGDALTHPLDFASDMGKRVWSGMKSKPVEYTAGIIGSLMLSYKITDYINKRRKEESKKRLDEQISKYVKLINEEGTEKAAQDVGADPKGAPEIGGETVGMAFLVPMAISAMITNRIIEKRRLDKKRAEERADSYPDDPVILYKTSSAEEIPVSPEAMLTMISIKSAMIGAVERSEGRVKSAAFSMNGLKNTWNGVKDTAKNMTDGVKSLGRMGFDVKDTSSLLAAEPMKLEDAEGEFMSALENGDNDPILAKMMKGYLDKGDEYDDSDDVLDIMGSIKDKGKRASMVKTFQDMDNRKRLRASMAKSNRLQSLLLKRMDDPAYANTWNPIVQEGVNRYLTTGINGNSGLGLDPNGIMYKILSWILNNTGLGKFFFRRGLGKEFDRRREATSAPAAGQQVAAVPVTRVATRWAQNYTPRVHRG